MGIIPCFSTCLSHLPHNHYHRLTRLYFKNIFQWKVKLPFPHQDSWAHRSCGSARTICSAGLMFPPAVGCWAILSMLLAKWENCQRRRDGAGVSTAKVNADVYPSHVHTAVLKCKIPWTVPTIRFIYLKLSGINLLETLRLDLYRTGQTEKKEEKRVFL